MEVEFIGGWLVVLVGFVDDLVCLASLEAQRRSNGTGAGSHVAVVDIVGGVGSRPGVTADGDFMESGLVSVDEGVGLLGVFWERGT